MIDWTQPIETAETPPRPVLVVYALGNDTPHGFEVLDVTREYSDEFWRMSDENRPTLRNVAPPKPEPTRHEGWVKLYSHAGQWPTAASSVYTSYDDALESVTKREPLAVCKVAWMSDGSPVPGTQESHDSLEWDELVAERDSLKAALEIARTQRDDASAEVERMTAERDRLKASLSLAEPYRDECHRLQAEVEKFRPVVEAAVAYGNSTDASTHNPTFVALMKATYAYQSTQPATSESHEATVGDVLDGIRNRYSAQASAPVKSCETCRFHCNVAIESCTENGHRGWEAKND